MNEKPKWKYPSTYLMYADKVYDWMRKVEASGEFLPNVAIIK